MKLDANLAYTLMESPSKLPQPEGTTDLEIVAASLQTASYVSHMIGGQIYKGNLHEAYSTAPEFINCLVRYFKAETIAAPLFACLWDEYYFDANATDRILSVQETATLIAQYVNSVHEHRSAGYISMLKDPDDPDSCIIARTKDIPTHQEDKYVLSIIANIKQVQVALDELCNIKAPLEEGNDTVDYRVLEEKMNSDHRYWLSAISSGYQTFTAINSLAVEEGDTGSHLPSLELYPGMQKHVADYLEKEIAHYRKILASV